MMNNVWQQVTASADTHVYISKTSQEREVATFTYTGQGCMRPSNSSHHQSRDKAEKSSL